MTVERKRKKTCSYLATFSVCVVFCENVHCTCLWGASKPLCVTMRCRCREATPQGGATSSLPLWLCSTQFFLEACGIVATFFCNSHNVLMLSLSFCLSMKCIKGLWSYSPSNLENSALQRVENCSFVHIFNIPGALKRTKRLMHEDDCPDSVSCVYWDGVCSPSFFLYHSISSEVLSFERQLIKMLIFPFFLEFLLQMRERHLGPFSITVLVN